MLTIRTDINVAYQAYKNALIDLNRAQEEIDLKKFDLKNGIAELVRDGDTTILGKNEREYETRVQGAFPQACVEIQNIEYRLARAKLAVALAKAEIDRLEMLLRAMEATKHVGD